MPTTITVLPNQNILDLVLSGCGSLESTMAFIAANNIGITDSLPVGTVLTVPDIPTNLPAVVHYLSQNSTLIGTGQPPVE
jgi:hypothetical protein